MYSVNTLSADHPLREDPSKPWPYVVVVGYRRSARQIVKTRRVYVRAIGPATAETDAVMYCRDSVPVYDDDGRKLIASRAVSVRPLDKADRINGDQS